MLSELVINAGGSKLEITRAIIETGLDIPVPRSIWKYSHQDFSSATGSDGVRILKLRDLEYPLIIRGSHPNDYHGFIDVVSTFRDVSPSNVEQKILMIEQALLRDDVKYHCDDWNQEPSPEVHILIQEQSRSPIIGSMMRHPHDKSIIMVEYADIRLRDHIRFHFREHNSFALIYQDERKNRYYDRCNISQSEIDELVEMYEKLEKSGILNPEWTHQVEFGLKPLLFFQARPFKKYQAPANFEIPKNNSDIDLQTNCVFGITPEEGIKVPYSQLFTLPEMRRFSTGDIPRSEPYAIVLGDNPQEPLETSQRLGNLKMIITGLGAGQIQSHSIYRFMKKADYSVNCSELNSRFWRILDKNDRVRLISNGLEELISFMKNNEER